MSLDGLRRYQRQGKNAYFDPIRAFLVEAKPEETVRQAFLQRLLGEYGVPDSALAVEYMLTKGGSTSRRRADIVVSGALGPLMVVECKEPGTPLHDGVFEQARVYADELGCSYIALTNGTRLDAFHRVADRWEGIAFPSFAMMHAPLRLKYREPPSREFSPLTSKQLNDLEFLTTHDRKLGQDWSYCVIGEDTPQELWTPIYSLYAAVFHRPQVTSALPYEKDGFRVEEYLGLHFLEYGNYSGGKFPGLYASFRVKDVNNDDQIYRVGFFSTMHTENHPTWGNRKGTSGIHVAIDDFDRTPHMSLELSLDTCLTQHRGRSDVVHDGKITVGRLGAAKRDRLIAFVAKDAPHLVRDSSVVLGSFPSGRPLAFADVSQLVFNLLHYAEIRDRFRAEYRRS